MSARASLEKAKAFLNLETFTDDQLTDLAVSIRELDSYLGSYIRSHGGFDITRVFTPSYDGIEKILSEKKILTPKINSIGDLIEFFSKNKNGACVIDQGLLSLESFNHHAIALFFRKYDDYLFVFVFDSQGTSSEKTYESVCSKIESLSGLKVRMLFSSLVAQRVRAEPVCSAFAIDFVEKSLSIENFFGEVFLVNKIEPLSLSGVTIVDAMPRSFELITKEAAALLLQRNIQDLVRAVLFNES